MKRTVRVVGLVLLAVSVAYFVSFVHRNATGIPPVQWGARAFAALLAAVVFSTLPIGLTAGAWSLLLAGAGHRAPRRAIAIFSVAQIGKYLPGNVAHLAGRIAVAARYGFDVQAVTLTLSFEATLLVVASLGWGLGVTFFALQGRSPGLAAPLVALSLAVLLGGLSWYFARHLERRRGGSYLLRPLFALQVIALYVLGFLCHGLALGILAHYLLEGPSISAILLSGLFALAWLPGFLAPGVPGGLGVREAVLVSLLTPHYGPDLAVTLALSSRVVSAVAEGLALLIGLWLLRGQPDERAAKDQSV